MRNVSMPAALALVELPVIVPPSTMPRIGVAVALLSLGSTSACPQALAPVNRAKDAAKPPSREARPVNDKRSLRIFFRLLKRRAKPVVSSPTYSGAAHCQLNSSLVKRLRDFVVLESVCRLSTALPCGAHCGAQDRYRGIMAAMEWAIGAAALALGAAIGAVVAFLVSFSRRAPLHAELANARARAELLDQQAKRHLADVDRIRGELAQIDNRREAAERQTAILARDLIAKQHQFDEQ